jgi:hypothetical protein
MYYDNNIDNHLSVKSSSPFLVPPPPRQFALLNQTDLLLDVKTL